MPKPKRIKVFYFLTLKIVLKQWILFRKKKDFISKFILFRERI